MAALTDRLLVSFDGETPHETTVRAFCEDNADDRTLCRRVRALSRGEHLTVGGGAAPHVAVVHMPRGATKRERQYKHVLASALAAGKADAVRIAAATVNKHRARLAATGKGPRLVTEGGSRRQWFPGKGERE